MALKQLSLRLYDILEEVGASEDIRRLHNKLSTSLGIFKTVSSNGLQNVYTCGSSFEGSVTPDLASDMDHLICVPFLPVVLDAAAAPAGLSYLMVRDDWTYPGYAKLQCVMEGLPLTEDLIRTIPYCVSDADGRLCLTHRAIGFEVGVACPLFVQNGFHFADLVGAFQCKMLPEFVTNRLCKLRQHKIISKSTAEKLGRLGCMFVGAGYFISHEKDIEFRLSLSMQEKYLMSNLNPTQHKVYILLKMIKNDVFEKELGCKVFTSYHCKTCVLYTAEMYEKHLWTPENLISGVLQCLKLLMRWLKSGFCPNFFIPDQNLFSKEGFSQFRRPLLHKLESLLKLKGDIFKLIGSDGIGHILQGVERERGNETLLKKCQFVLNYTYIAVNYEVELFRMTLCKRCGGEYDAARLDRLMRLLQQTDSIYGYTSVQTQSALSHWYPWIHLHIAKVRACESFRYQDTPQRKRLISESDSHFKMAKQTDLVNVRLAKASILYRAGQYEACFWLLQQVEHLFTYRVNRVCPCNFLRTIDQAMDIKAEMVISMGSISERKLMRRYVACCVMYLPSESDIVPAPLQYEMRRSHGTRPLSRDEEIDFWFDWAVVDAKVFLYFMQYLVSGELGKETHKQVATANIVAEIEEDERRTSQCPNDGRRLGHRETAYNLLGWIYMQQRRNSEALRCFEKSWAIRPNHNAAKFHMRDLMNKL